MGQNILRPDTLSAPLDYENVFVKKISDDSLQTSFIIWIKKNVPEHYHETHTESIYVLEGVAEMTMNGRKQKVRKGDLIYIPSGTVHAVSSVFSRKPLKVISIQSPHFDGTDRIMVK